MQDVSTWYRHPFCTKNKNRGVLLPTQGWRRTPLSCGCEVWTLKRWRSAQVVNVKERGVRSNCGAFWADIFNISSGYEPPMSIVWQGGKALVLGTISQSNRGWEAYSRYRKLCSHLPNLGKNRSILIAEANSFYSQTEAKSFYFQSPVQSVIGGSYKLRIRFTG